MTQKITDYDGLTKQTIERDPTETESADFAERAEKIAQFHNAITEKAKAKKTAEGKLAALGLTTADLRALGLQPLNEALALCSWYTVKRSD